MSKPVTGELSGGIAGIASTSIHADWPGVVHITLELEDMAPDDHRKMTVAYITIEGGRKFKITPLIARWAEPCDDEPHLTLEEIT